MLMHETVVAQSLFDMITAEAKKQNARPVAANISCGAFEGVNEQILNFAFEAIAKGSLCEAVKLQITRHPIRCECNQCRQISDFEITNPACPKCGSDDFELLTQQPLLLDEIEFEGK